MLFDEDPDEDFEEADRLRLLPLSECGVMGVWTAELSEDGFDPAAYGLPSRGKLVRGDRLLGGPNVVMGFEVKYDSPPWSVERGLKRRIDCQPRA